MMGSRRMRHPITYETSLDYLRNIIESLSTDVQMDLVIRNPTKDLWYGEKNINIVITISVDNQ